MNLTYSSTFKEQALVKVYSRGDRTIQSIADELNMKILTLKYWMKTRPRLTSEALPKLAQEKRPQDWRVEEQLQALQETYGLDEEALNAWCRERGLFVHHLKSWKSAFCGVQTNAETTAPNKRELRDLKEENDKLKRDLHRKEKALAEAAALLVLQKSSKRCGRTRKNDVAGRTQSRYKAY